MYRIIHNILQIIWLIPRRNNLLIMKIISFILIVLIYFIIIFPLHLYYKLSTIKKTKVSSTFFINNKNQYNNKSFNDKFI